MKMFCISDNIDTYMGMRLAGIEGVVVHEREEIILELEKLINTPNIAIVFMTTKIVECCSDIISQYKLDLARPLLVEIPDRHGSSNIGESIDKYISEAIGIKL